MIGIAVVVNEKEIYQQFKPKMSQQIVYNIYEQEREEESKSEGFGDVSTESSV